MTWEWLLGVLPLLVFLACPIAMFWMMRGTGVGACGKADAEPDTVRAEGVKAPSPVTDGEIADLRARLARLEAKQNGAPEESRHRIPEPGDRRGENLNTERMT